jgi:hypothetical protein
MVPLWLLPLVSLAAAVGLMTPTGGIGKGRGSKREEDWMVVDNQARVEAETQQ